MDFYGQSTSHPSRLHIRSETVEGSQSLFPNRYTPTATTHSDNIGGSSQVFVGSPWATGGYLDELPLMEGKYVNSLTILDLLHISYEMSQN